MRKHSISTRLLLLFLCLLLPLVALGGYLLIDSVHALQQSTDEMVRTGLSELCHSLENRVINVQYDLQNFLVSECEARELLAYGQSYSPAQYWTLVKKLKKGLMKICRDEELLADTTLFFPTYNQKISAKKGLQMMEATEYEWLIEASRKQAWGMAALDGQFYISYFFPLSTNSKHEPQLALVSVISSSKLRTALEMEMGSVVTLASTDGDCVVASDEDFSIALIEKDHCMDANGKGYRAYTMNSVILDCTLSRFIPEKMLSQKKVPLICIAVCYFGIVFAIALLYMHSVKNMLQRPVNMMMEALNSMRRGKWDYQIENTANIRELSELIDGFNEMLGQLDELIKSRYEMEEYTRTVELRHLQAQINPHFLFNTLYMLRHMIDAEDIENASLLATYLGGYFRYVYDTHSLTISLDHEYTHARNYLNIQCMRFGQKLISVLPPLPAELHSLDVPKLILQPLYENSILYAMHEDDTPLVVSTSFFVEDGKAEIIVEDNGHSLTEDKFHALEYHTFHDDARDKPTALGNIRKRLELQYNGEYEMKLIHTECGGLRIAITLPMKEPRINEHTPDISGVDC